MQGYKKSLFYTGEEALLSLKKALSHIKESISYQM